MASGRSLTDPGCCIARTFALVACLAFAACSSPQQVVQEKHADGEFRILPATPLAGNELSLAWGHDAQSARSVTSLASDASQGYAVIWQINGNKVGRGLSLPAGIARRGDRVSVRLESDPPGQERSAVVIGNSPPEVRNVSVSRDGADPNIAIALFDARDPDGDNLRHHFEWTVDGQLVEGNDSPRLSLDGNRRGQEIAVRVSASDGELATSRTSTGAKLENHPPTIEIAASPRIVDREDGPWAELDLAATDPDGDPVQIRVNGDVDWNPESGMVSWKLGELDEVFDVTITATDAPGASAQRRTRLKR